MSRIKQKPPPEGGGFETYLEINPKLNLQLRLGNTVQEQVICLEVV